MFKVKRKCILGDLDMATYCVRFDYNDKYLAASKQDGSIQIFNMYTEKMSYVLNGDMEHKSPTVCIR